MNFLTLITMVKNEPSLDEFIEYYLSQGIDVIHIIDDMSDPPVVVRKEFQHRVQLRSSSSEVNVPFYGKHTYNLNLVYQQIKNTTEWVGVIDADEFICTRKNFNKTIVQELKDTFSEFDCIKIPWVLMCYNKRQKDPRSLLIGNIYRWNYDTQYTMPNINIDWLNPSTPNEDYNNFIRKWNSGKVYYNSSIKCIFRPSKFLEIRNPHKPWGPIDNPSCVDGVRCNSSPAPTNVTNSGYPNLREEDIQSALLLTYHYKLISLESINRKKLRDDENWQRAGMSIITSWDHPDVVDTTMRDKWIQYLSQDKIF